LGVEVSYALTAFHSDKEQKRHPILMFLDILELFYKKQQYGESVSEHELLQIIGRSELGRLPAYILQLEQQNLVKRTDQDEYVLVKNLENVDFWSFFTALPYSLPLKNDLLHLHQDDEWIARLGPALVESDEFLAAKLSIPLASLFETK
jgi:membrane protein